MKNLERKDLNQIIIQGPIVRKFSNHIATNLVVKTPKLNLPGFVKEGETCYNYPDVAFYGSEKDSVAETYQEGDVVKIVGTVQTQKKVSKDTGRTYFEQRLIGLSIEEAEKELAEFGLDAGAYTASENRVKLMGTISKLSLASKNVLNINIRTFYNGRVNNIQTFIYGRRASSLMEELTVGDKVCAVGSIQTPKKIVGIGEEKEERHFRNIVLSSISKI